MVSTKQPKLGLMEDVLGSMFVIACLFVLCVSQCAVCYTNVAEIITV